VKTPAASEPGATSVPKEQDAGGSSPTAAAASSDTPPSSPVPPPVVRRLNLRAPLEGKVVVITLKSDPSYSLYLQDCRLQPLGTSSFLVGTGVDVGDDWTAERRVWVAVDDISQLIEFDTAEELRKTLDGPDVNPDA